jgi:hypothetical protein
MEAITLIIACSTIIWYIVDRFHELWSNLSFGKYITIGIVGVLGILATLTFNLDIMVAVNVTSEVTVFGQICTVLLLMGGSSCIAEIIERIKGGNKDE